MTFDKLLIFLQLLLNNKLSNIKSNVRRTKIHLGCYEANNKIIVIIRNWLGNPANFKGTNKDQKIYVGRSTTLHNLLFCAHTLGLNCVTVTFLLVSSSGTNYDLLFLCRVMAKKANKNIHVEQRILSSFLTIHLY